VVLAFVVQQGVDQPFDLGSGFVNGLSPAILSGRAQWTNDSGNSKHIARAAADCACLHLGFSRDDVAPGGSFTVYAELAISKAEDKDVGASVVFSDGSVKRVLFHGSGRAGARATMVPRQALFQSDVPTTTRFFLPFPKSESVPVLTAKSDHAGLEARVLSVRHLTASESSNQSMVAGEIELVLRSECPLPCKITLLADGADVGDFIAIPR